MSHLDDLIAQHCPEGVEFKTLGQIGSLYGGLTGKSKKDFTDGNARFVSYVNVFNNGATDLAADDRVHIGPGERQKKVLYGDVLFTVSSENPEEVGMSSTVVGEPPEDLYLNSFCLGFRPTDPALLLPEFAEHLLRSPGIRRQIVRTANGVTRFNLSKARFAEVEIPLPPPAVQREIASILDKMTRLKAELEAELEARSRQYAYYRDSLLSSAEGGTVRWATLSEISLNVFSGGTPLSTRSEYYGGDIPWLRTQEVDYSEISATAVKITQRGLENSSAKWVRTNSVIVAISGAGVTRGRVAINKIPLATNQHCCNLEIDAKQANHRFVYYWLVHNYGDLRSRGQGNRSDLNVGIIKDYPIAVPPPEEQKRIVMILDEFNALVNDLSIGLPAEINARRQQYEYYRDRLLTFERRAA